MTALEASCLSALEGPVLGYLAGLVVAFIELRRSGRGTHLTGAQ